MTHEHARESPVTPAEAWELRYAESPKRWSGDPNPHLVDVAVLLRRR